MKLRRQITACIENSSRIAAVFAALSLAIACGDAAAHGQDASEAAEPTQDVGPMATPSEPAPSDPDALDVAPPTGLTPAPTTEPSATVPSGAPAAVPPAGSTPAAEPTPAMPRATLTVSGRQLLDSCGNPFVVRGVEQIFAEQLPQGNDWVGLIEQIAQTGVNAVRVLANTDTLSIGDVDALLGVLGKYSMVGYVTPYGNENIAWLEHDNVKAMLAKHEKYIIIDAFGEPTFDDRARFVSQSTAAIRRMRELGYRVPLTVTANQYGRDLPSLLELGAQVTAADPLHNTILGWQAYWGSNGYYQQRYGLTFAQAIEAISAAPFPIQLGLDRVTDYPSRETADFGFLLGAAEDKGIGWLWWDWYNPYGNENNLTTNGRANSLTPTGQTVINGHVASVEKTAKRTCPVTADN